LSGRVPSSKIRSAHLERLAVVYIRQSSPQQVLENRESTARQYAFAEHAVALGWPRDRVLIIDEDLGKSGRTAEGRSGFQRLVTEVTLHHVGLVLGLEMSRLARSSRDWHNLFEMCALCDTLLADEDGVYDPNDPNDRLLLGLKGIMSEMELHMMRNRLGRGRDNKAGRGELFHGVPMGYVILPTGEVEFDPDEQARFVVKLVFDKFQELGSIYGMFHWLIQHDIPVADPTQEGAQEGAIGMATAIDSDARPGAAPSHLRGSICIRSAARRSERPIHSRPSLPPLGADGAMEGADQGSSPCLY
jgi:DNA invertase Pin-like site-specific DNA recombinase